jgi:hypothetical protein
METCLLIRSLAMGLHVTIHYVRISSIGYDDCDEHEGDMIAMRRNCFVWGTRRRIKEKFKINLVQKIEENFVINQLRNC